MVSTLLLDCDGVLQHNPRFWEGLGGLVGDEAVMREMLHLESGFMRGEKGWRAALEGFLAERQIDAPADDLFEIWHDTRVVDGMLDLVDRVRAGGTRVYLATNQQELRGAHMQANLPYAEHTDGAFYSYEVGHAKPSAEYFAHICTTLRIEPSEALFVDDLEPNVAAAREYGLHAELMEPRGDLAVLEAILVRHGLLPEPTATA